MDEDYIDTTPARPYDEALRGAQILPARRSAYDRSFAPGEATTEDVRASLLEMFLSGLGLVPGGALSASAPRAVGGRTRRIGPDVQTRSRTIRDQERDARPAGYPQTKTPRVGPTVQEMNEILAKLERSGR